MKTQFKSIALAFFCTAFATVLSAQIKTASDGAAASSTTSPEITSTVKTQVKTFVAGLESVIASADDASAATPDPTNEKLAGLVDKYQEPTDADAAAVHYLTPTGSEKFEGTEAIARFYEELLKDEDGGATDVKIDFVESSFKYGNYDGEKIDLSGDVIITEVDAKGNVLHTDSGTFSITLERDSDEEKVDDPRTPENEKETDGWDVVDQYIIITKSN